MNLSPKTIRPEPIYSFRPHQSPQLQKAGYPPNWSQWSKWKKKRLVTDANYVAEEEIKSNLKPIILLLYQKVALTILEI